MLIYAFFGLAAPLNLLSAVSLNIADATDGESPAGRRLRRFMPLLLTLAVLGLGELFGDTEDAGRIMAETLPLSLLFGFGVCIFFLSWQHFRDLKARIFPVSVHRYHQAGLRRYAENRVSCNALALHFCTACLQHGLLRSGLYKAFRQCFGL